LIDTSLLLIVLAAELAVLLLVLGLLIIRSVLLALRGPGRRRRIRQAESDLITAIESGRPTSYPFAKLGRKDQIEVIFELLPSLSGEPRKRLAAVASDNGIADWGLKWCDSRHWFVRLRGAEVLSVLGERGPVLMLLGDERAEVRIRAVEWAAAEPQSAELEKLCLMLGDPDPGVRFTVADGLLRVGGNAVNPLVRTIERDAGPDTTEAALRVASGIGDHRLAALAIEHCQDPRDGVRAAAAAACGSVGGDDAARTLISLLDDPDPDVRREAVNSLGRMNSWASAPKVAALLGDDEWPVKRAAAVVLDGFGPPGRLYLRRVASSDDGPAAKIASQALGTFEAEARA